MTSIQALQWLGRRSKHIKIGFNYYEAVAGCIRRLLLERAQLLRDIEKLEAENLKFTTPKPKSPDGSSSWDVT